MQTLRKLPEEIATDELQIAETVANDNSLNPVTAREPMMLADLAATVGFAFTLAGLMFVYSYSVIP